MPNPIINRRVLAASTKSLSAKTLDWANRVVSNGGSRPSNATLFSVDSWYLGMLADGLDSKILTASFIAPDNITAALTPFYKVKGSDPWAETGFAAGDFSINGLRGNTTQDNRVNTGLNPSTDLASANSASVIIYAYSVTSGGFTDFGVYNGGGQGFNTSLNNGGNFYGAVADNSSASIGPVASPGQGYYCLSRTANNALNAYFANSGTAHHSFASNTNVNSQAMLNLSCWFWCLSVNGAVQSFSPNTYSFCAIATGLTSSDSSKLFNRVQTLRQAFGGGYR